MAAVVEQRHDENGIVWPASIAPYDVHVLALHGGAAEVLALAEKVASILAETGLEVLLDDRDERPGEKFADADLDRLPAAGHRRERSRSTTARSTFAAATARPRGACRCQTC